MLKRFFQSISRFRHGGEYLSRDKNQAEVEQVFKAKYTSFKKLLDSNAEFLNIQAEIEEKLRGDSVFGMGFVRSRSTMAVYQAMRMVQSLNELTNNRYQMLMDILDKINSGIKSVMDDTPEAGTDIYVFDYDSVTREMIEYVGGKNANLGELKSRLGMSVPEGFAITTRVFYDMFKANDLFEEIKKIRMGMDPQDLENITTGSEKIQSLILNARVPDELETILLNAYDALVTRADRKVPAGSGKLSVALRSSAIGEDSEQSHAGQYVSFLNVSRDRLISTYKFILAGLFIPRAIVYRLNKGIRDEDTAMSVACVQMVDALAAGVAYSRHPIDPRLNTVLINSVWGLGGAVVDGSVIPDTFILSRDKNPEILEVSVSEKKTMLSLRQDRDGLEQVDVPQELQNTPSLETRQVQKLASLVLAVEKHYGGAQDVEWALDKNGEILFLQTRPLSYSPMESSSSENPDIAADTKHKPVVQGGAIACPGVGFGPCWHVHSRNDLKNFPQGGVLAAKKSSPQFVMVMSRASAIVTEAGSVTGHMASLAREFNVPAVLGVKEVLDRIPHGTEITVDAHTGGIYQGRVESILARKKKKELSMKGTPVFNILREIGKLITPLNLSDPQGDRFSPEHCCTLHDIARFVHEVSYRAMFQLSDIVSGHGRMSMKLSVSLPIDLYLIDLGGGVRNGLSGSACPCQEDIVSIPFKSLLDGMLHPGLRWNQPRPIEWKGLLSVMGEQLLNPQMGQERFGDRSYAIISDKYLNFSSRVGYHYAVLDSYCGENINKNYITFAFKGGAADDQRRNRRVRAISTILERLDFRVRVREDRVDSRFRKDEQKEIESRLDQLGRLLIYTRQMDMLMFNEQCVDLFADSFFKEDYALECFYDRAGSSAGND